jgi:hypothetical protein
MSNKGQYDHNWRKIRASILQRDGFICTYCGRHAQSVDHIIPLSKGGTNDPDNLTAACNTCNSSKRDNFYVQQITHHVSSSFSPLGSVMTRIKPQGAFSETIGSDLDETGNA